MEDLRRAEYWIRKNVESVKWFYEAPRIEDLNPKQLWLSKRVLNYMASITQVNAKGVSRYVYVLSQAGYDMVDGVKKVIGRRVLSGWASNLDEAKRRIDDRIIEIELLKRMGLDPQLEEGEVIGDAEPEQPSGNPGADSDGVPTSGDGVPLDDAGHPRSAEGDEDVSEGRGDPDGSDALHDPSEDAGPDLRGK